jgi:hypothetical protein
MHQFQFSEFTDTWVSFDPLAATSCDGLKCLKEFVRDGIHFSPEEAVSYAA